VAFSADGTRLAGGSVNVVRVWDTAGGKEMFTLAAHQGTVTTVTFTPDGERLASAFSDMTVKLWDVSTGQLVLTLKGHTDAVTAWRSTRMAGALPAFPRIRL